MLDFLQSKEFIQPVIIAVVTIVLYTVVTKILNRVINTNIKNIDKRRTNTILGLLKNTVKYVLLIIAFMMILDVYGVDTKAILASFGIIGLVIGLALQDTIKDFLSGMTIIIENQYRVGDIVTLGNFKGEVISLGLKTTKIKSQSGEVKIVSNRNISEIINHSVENSMAIVDIPFDDSVKIVDVENKINEICDSVVNELKDIVHKVTPLGVQKITTGGFEYRVIASTEPLKNTIVERHIMKKVKEIFTTKK